MKNDLTIIIRDLEEILDNNYDIFTPYDLRKFENIIYDLKDITEEI